ncbi:hypothetical protein LCGC14_1899950, partial [marine sediment metagenome]
VKPEQGSDQTVEVEGLLFKEDGSLTLEGEICGTFLDDVDFTAIFDDPEVRAAELVTSEEKWFVVKDGELIEAKEGDEGAELYTIESLDPEILAQVLDDEDLVAMFEYFVTNEMPNETLEDKARLAAAMQLLGIEEDDVDEAKGPFKKGTFKKMHAAGAKDQVARMLIAMLKKESIKRAAKGKGYKGGDYKKAKGYAGGTPAGIKKWQAYRKKKAGAIAKAAKKAKKGKKVAGRFAKKAGAKKGAAKKLAKKGAGEGKRAVSASEELRTPVQLTEQQHGAKLAGSMLESMHRSSLLPVEKPKKKEA